MNRIKMLAGGLGLLLAIFGATAVNASEEATPEEVLQKVKQAAEFLAASGEAGLAEFMDINGRWVWKDTYVWVLHCEKGTNAAHAIKPDLVGKKLMSIKDPKGRLFFADFCNVAKQAQGGWVEYWWPKVEERTPSRKITYIMQVPGSPYQVGAGVYNETLAIEDLNKLIQ